MRQVAVEGASGGTVVVASPDGAAAARAAVAGAEGSNRRFAVWVGDADEVELEELAADLRRAR